jgi:O-antigen ligase
VLAQRQSIGSRRYSRIALAILGAGLIATLSRGPRVGALILVMVYMVTGPMAVANLARFAVLGAIVLLALLLTPVGSGLFDLLPFVGSVDAGSVTYRQQLFAAALVVIERNPWFGSGDFRLEPEMQELIQGQHIIDVVNTYLEIALNFGLIGLGLFASFFASVLVGLWRVRKFQVLQNMGLDAYMRASMATLVAILVTIGTVSSVDYIPYVYWSFAGICVALVRVAYKERATVAGDADAIRVPA